MEKFLTSYEKSSMAHVGKTGADCLAFSLHTFTTVCFDEFVVLFLLSCTAALQSVLLLIFYHFLVVIH